MSFILLDGYQIAKDKRQELKENISTLEKKPSLHVLLVGDYAPSEIYVRRKEEACAEVGIGSIVHKYPSTITTAELYKEIKNFNQDSSVDGILVQLPLPRHIDQHKIIETIAPQKDADGLTSSNLGALVQGDPFIVPCTAQACLQLIKKVQSDIAGEHVVIIGRSALVGKPLLHLLLNENATVTLCHSKTRDLKKITKQADILVAAIGQPGMITADYVKPGAIVIDVGISRNAQDEIEGDVDFNQIKNIARAISPVPKGVGPMTVLNLLINTLKCAGVYQGKD